MERVMKPEPSLAGFLAVAMVTIVSPAAAFDLEGLWTTNAANCSKVFAGSGSQITLAEDSDIYGGGFIVQGNTIRGKIAKCTIKSRKVDGSSLHLLTSCATDVMLSNTPFDVTFKDENTLSRVFPGDADMSETYYRCP
jgi:hypothetical protein